MRQTYGVEPGMLYFKSGDSLAAIIEQSVSYGNILRYKKLGDNAEYKARVSELRAISTPYTFLESVRLQNKELLMTLLADGEIKLYNYVTFFSSAPKEVYGQLATTPNPQKVRYALKTDSITFEVTKENFDQAVPPLLRKAPHLVKFITEKNLIFEDIETIISEYNIFAYRKTMSRSITGRVLDSETKKGVSGAAVFIPGSTEVTRTNALGYFNVYVLPTDTFRVSHSKYHQVRLSPPQATSFQFSIPKLTAVEIDSVRRFESSLTTNDFLSLVNANLYYPYADRRNKREGLVVAVVKLDTTGYLKAVELTQFVGGCGFALTEVLSQVPQSFWRPLIKKHNTTDFTIPVIFSLDKQKETDIKINGRGKVLDPIYFTYRYEELEYDEGTFQKTKVFRMYNMQFETKE